MTIFNHTKTMTSLQILLAFSYRSISSSRISLYNRHFTLTYIIQSTVIRNTDICCTGRYSSNGVVRVILWNKTTISRIVSKNSTFLDVSYKLIAYNSIFITQHCITLSSIFYEDFTRRAILLHDGTPHRLRSSSLSHYYTKLQTQIHPRQWTRPWNVLWRARTCDSSRRICRTRPRSDPNSACRHIPVSAMKMFLKKCGINYTKKGGVILQCQLIQNPLIPNVISNTLWKRWAEIYDKSLTTYKSVFQTLWKVALLTFHSNKRPFQHLPERILWALGKVALPTFE